MIVVLIVACWLVAVVWIIAWFRWLSRENEIADTAASDWRTAGTMMTKDDYALYRAPRTPFGDRILTDAEHARLMAEIGLDA